MKKTVAIVVLGAILVALAAPAAQAHGHGASNAALALAAFAAFNVLFLPFTLLAAAVPPPAAYSPPAAYAPPAYTYSTPTYASAPAVTQVAAAPAAPRISREVVYPHGRYLLYGDGVSRAYHWVWVPNPPPPGSAPGY